MKGITTIASLPGSGSGCQSALPAEAHRQRAKEAGPEMFAPGKITSLTSRRDFIEFTPLGSGVTVRLNVPQPDLLDAAGGGK